MGSTAIRPLDPSSVRWGIKLPNCGGVLCPPEWARPDVILNLASLAEALGYDAVWLHDHLVTPDELQHLEPDFHEPLITMGAIAAATRRLQVGVATIIAPLRDPVLLAKQISTMAVFYPDRFLIGLGAGRYASEFGALGLDTFAQRGSVSAEHLKIVRALMTEDVVQHSGRTRTLANVSQRPHADPRPPLLYAGNVPAAARRAARLADGWIGASTPPSELRETVEMMRRLREEEGIGRPFTLAYSATVARQESAPLSGGSPADGRELHIHASALAGDAEAIRGQLVAYVEAGITHFQLSLRSKTLDELRENMAWFSSEVMAGFPMASRTPS